jgi:hypothetical protein
MATRQNVPQALSAEQVKAILKKRASIPRGIGACFYSRSAMH